MLRIVATLLVAVALFPTAAAKEPADRPVDREFIKGLARRIEPDLKGRPERISQYVDFFRREAANDARLFVFDVAAEAEGQGGVRLAGHVEFPETRAAIVACFEALGFEPVENRIETLPTADLGEEKYGFIKVANSLSYAEPAEREIVTDCLLGEPVFLLREEDGHFLVHGGDGYLGWVAAKDIQRVDAKRFDDYLKGSRVWIRSDFKTEDGLTMPAGGRLKVLSVAGGKVSAELPGGEPTTLPDEVCDVQEPPDETIDVVCQSARQLLGTKYLWGGKTSKGVDCSGLVQLSFARAGVRVPRDSNQQVLVGELSATRWNRAGLRRGDTLYFINPQGRVSHTGLYLGENQFIHAVSPVVRVNSFNPDDENYAAPQDASFAFARRLWK